MVIQSVSYIPEQLETGKPVVMYELTQVRTCFAGLITILVVEPYIFLFESSKILEVGVYLKEQIFELMDICIESKTILVRRRI